MDPRGCDNAPAPMAPRIARRSCAPLVAVALLAVAFLLATTHHRTAQAERVQVLRRIPVPPPEAAAVQASRHSVYDARNVLHDAWNEPGMTWFANWRTYADDDDGLVDVYQTMFQNPHEEDVPPPPPGTVVERPREALTEGQTIGEAPEDYTVQFLRQQSVLLKHGEWQLDYGIQYSITDNDIPIALLDGFGDVTGVVEGGAKNRLLLTPIELRYGVTERMQAFINVPLGWSNSEIAFTDFDEFESQIGIGDVSAGLSILLCDGCRHKPDVIATLGFTAPTGNPDFPLLTTLTPNSVLGEGFWGASAQLLFIHSYDPVVLFWGFGYRYRFEEDFANPVLAIQQDVRPGQTAFYQCGVGFGVNEWITLSTSFAGAYISELYVDNDRVEGTILEPLRLRVAVTINTPAKLIEPFTEIGMTDAAVDARFGVTWTHTHRRCAGCGY